MDVREQELIRRAQEGDSRSFDALVRTLDVRIIPVAYGILGNMPDAHDAFQEGVLKAWSSLSSFRAESAFATWLTRIVINQALNMKSKRRWSLREQDVPGHEPVVDHREHPDAMIMRTELSRDIHGAMDRLSDRERTVFVLKHMHGYKLREISDMIDCAEGTVKNYLFRATRKLRDALTPVERPESA